MLSVSRSGVLDFIDILIFFSVGIAIARTYNGKPDDSTPGKDPKR